MESLDLSYKLIALKIKSKTLDREIHQLPATLVFTQHLALKCKIDYNILDLLMRICRLFLFPGFAE